jgi:hypothetical protein
MQEQFACHQLEVQILVVARAMLANMLPVLVGTLYGMQCIIYFQGSSGVDVWVLRSGVEGRCGHLWFDGIVDYVYLLYGRLYEHSHVFWCPEAVPFFCQ